MSPMPPEAMCRSTSKMPLSVVPGASRAVASDKYMSDIPLLPDIVAGRVRRHGGRSGRIEVDHHDRDVVGGATIERQRQQQIAGPLRRVMGCGGGGPPVPR